MLDTAWQLRVGGALINAAPFPLIGLVLLHFAASQDPGDALPVMRSRISDLLDQAADRPRPGHRFRRPGPTTGS